MNCKYKESDIAKLLETIKDYIAKDCFIISLNKNRIENLNFIKEYSLKEEAIKEILLQIETKDFCYSTPNRKPGYEKELLHIFCPTLRLCNIFAEEKLIDVYIKFNILPENVIIISFHQKNKDIHYAFR